MAKVKDPNTTVTIKDKDGNDITITDGTFSITDTFSPLRDSTWSTRTTTPMGHNWMFDSFVGSVTIKEKCSKCKKEEEVHIRYNWNDDKKLERIICKKCHTAAMDKMFGLDNNIKAEEALYGKRKSNK